MGLLVDGVWKTDWYDTKSTGGEFVRGETQFRNWIGVMPASRRSPIDIISMFLWLVHGRIEH